MNIRYALVALVTWVVSASATTANAQNPLNEVFKAVGELLGQPEPAQPMLRQPVLRKAGAVRREVNDDVGADFVNMYTPFLKKALTAELHFVKKVCDPNDKQFDEIHRAGLLAVAVTSKHYEELQKMRQNANQWPDPRVRLSTALAAAIEKVMPGEAAQRYRQEIQARQEALQDADAGMMLVHIDAELLLSPQQHDEIAQELKAKWNEGWSSGPRLYMYPQYARLPEAHILRPHLTELQRSLWSQRLNNSSVNFGWQMELGLQDWFGNVIELEAFEPPGPVKSQPDSAEDAAQEIETEKVPGIEPEEREEA